MTYINNIMDQTSLKIFDEKYDSRALPFKSIQEDIISKGKNLQFKSAKFVANWFVRPEMKFKSKDTQTNRPDPLEERINELLLFNENLEDNIKDN